MKKFFAIIMLALVTVGANAQFEQGKYWVGASVTGFDLSYSSSTKLNLGLNASAGYFLKDNILVKGNLGLNVQGKNTWANEITLGAGGRYYMNDNGIYLGADLNYIHSNTNYNDLVPQFEVGYSFFVNRNVMIEPAVYYRQAFSDNDFSRFGIKIGIGLDLEETLKVFGLKK